MSLRSVLAASALLSITNACGGEVAPPPLADQSAGYRVWVPGELLGRFPPDPLDMSAELLLEGAFTMSVNAAEDGVFVLDAMGSKVVYLDSEARVRGVLDRRGGGPGEFQNPISVQAAPDGGVWVADPQLNRLTLFDADGRLEEEIRTPNPVINFTILRNGTPIFPTMATRTLLASARGEADVVDLLVDPSAVPKVLGGGPIDRLGQGILSLAEAGRDTIVMIRNRDVSDFLAWTVVLDPSHTRIDEIRPLPLPGWLHTMIQDALRPYQDGRSAGAIPPLKSSRVVNGTVWLAPSPSGVILGVSLARSPGDSTDVVLPRADGETHDVLDMAVLGDRLVGLYQTEIRIYQLERAPAGSFELRR